MKTLKMVTILKDVEGHMAGELCDLAHALAKGWVRAGLAKPVEVDVNDDKDKDGKPGPDFGKHLAVRVIEAPPEEKLKAAKVKLKAALAAAEAAEEEVAEAEEALAKAATKAAPKAGPKGPAGKKEPPAKDPPKKPEGETPPAGTTPPAAA